MYTITYRKRTKQVRYPTIKDVAEKAGVSTATVLRVIHNNGYVSKETRAKVLEAIESVGYYFNMIARNLKKSGTCVIGHVILGHYHNPFFARVAYGVESAANNVGYHVINAFSYGDPKREEEAVNLLISRRVDGIIFTTPIKEENIYKALKVGIPVVMVERPLDIPIGDCVLVDNFTGAYEAVKYLISMGHQRIGFIGTDPHSEVLINSTVELERYEGYKKALFEYDKSLKSELVKFSSNYTVEWGSILGEELLKNPGNVSAIFAASDILAVGVLQAIYQRNLRIPRDISVIGFDDSLAIYTSPPLTTVAQPVEALGREAVEILLKRVTGEVNSVQERILLDCELIVRNSVLNCKDR